MRVQPRPWTPTARKSWADGSRPTTLKEKKLKAKIMAVFFFLSMAAMAGAENEPPFEYKFEKFAVTDDFKGTPAKPKIKSKGHRLFRTQLLKAASTGPNFAGHYTVASWGCGSDGCTSFSIIDAKTGEILEGVGTTVSRSCKQDWQEKTIIYKPDSSLFIINGNLNDEDLGVFYYELKDKKLKLLKSTPHPKEKKSCY